MAANTFGEIFRTTTFGESHGLGVGVIVDGCPSGLELSESDIQPDLDRRKPGQSKITTQRKESDTIKILSGVFEGKTTGAPIAMMVFNEDQKSADYDKLKDLYRPSHADFTYAEKYGIRDHRGGGRSSARIMIARVAAGAIAKKYLKEKLNIEFLAYTEQVGEIKIPDNNFPNLEKFYLETDRLKLVPMSFDYAQEIFTEFTPEIAKYLPVVAGKLADTLNFIHYAIKDFGTQKIVTFVVLNKLNNEFIGVCDFHNLESSNANFGLWIKKSAQQKGYGTELIAGLKNWALKNLPNKKLIYRVDRANIGSQKIALGLGGKLIKEYIEVKEDLGKTFDWIEYDMGDTVSEAESSVNTVTSNQIEANIVRCPDPETATKMIELIEKVKSEGDSIGGVIQGIIRGLPVGLGEPEFDKLPALLAHAMMSINATKGFEIGSGFEGVKLRGSQHNDEFVTDEKGEIKTKTNNSGGVQGGISNGQIVNFRVAIKPVATIAKSQKTVDKEGREVDVEGKGRHDPCVLPRAVPIVEAMSALVIIDLYLRNLKK